MPMTFSPQLRLPKRLPLLHSSWLLPLLLAACLLAACSPASPAALSTVTPASGDPEAGMAATLTQLPLEPALAASSTAAGRTPNPSPSYAPPPAAASPARLTPSPQPEGSACQNALQFVADLTIPDGSLLARGAQVDKRWQVQNTGTCSWDSRYMLVQVLGPELGLPAEQTLYPAPRGAAAVIRMLLTTPLEPGVYTAAWQARSPSGELFGDVIYIEFQVN